MCKLGDRFRLVYSEKRNKKQCHVIRCRNPKATGKNVCHRCRKRIWRLNNRERALWSTIRDHAKERKIEFALPFEWFREWCKETEYINQVGIKHFMLHIDRKDRTRGYVPDNVQVLTCSENSSKGNREKYAMKHRGIIIEDEQPDIDCPF